MPHFLESPLTAPSPAAPLEHTPTAEQAAIITAATTTRDNLLISALAGAAKTSTLVMLANHPTMMEIPTLTLAFNKKIAEEMKNRLPPNCISLTLNSLGHKVWGQAIGRRLHVSTKKNYDIVKDLIDKEKRKDLKDDLYTSFSDLLRTLAHGKSQGWVPDSCTRRHTSLLTDEEFFTSLDEELPAYHEALLTKALLRSIDLAYSGQIDFDDQLYMPTCFPSKFPQYPLVMVDEAQDLSPLNHAMLEQIVRTLHDPEPPFTKPLSDFQSDMNELHARKYSFEQRGKTSNRLIAVGDQYQAIYAFRGAYGDSMTRLQQKFSMTEFTLSISFRCPVAVIDEAHWRAPHMTAPDWAKPGTVSSLGTWSIDDLPQDAVILCRNNAPIYNLAIMLLTEGRYPQIVGNDIGKTLLKALAKLGDRSLPREEAYAALETYQLHRLSRTRDHAKASVKDFCKCLRIFLDHGETLGGAINYAEHLMTVTGPIKMMTGHKSKGLEFPHTFILDRHLLRTVEDEEGGRGMNQDRNLLYVMQTRAQEMLTYITSENFVMTSATKEKVDDE